MNVRNNDTLKALDAMLVLITHLAHGSTIIGSRMTPMSSEGSNEANTMYSDDLLPLINIGYKRHDRRPYRAYHER